LSFCFPFILLSLSSPPPPSLHTPRPHSGVRPQTRFSSHLNRSRLRPPTTQVHQTRRLFAFSRPSFFLHTKSLLALDEHCSSALLISFQFLLFYCCFIALIWLASWFRAKLRLRSPTIANALTVATLNASAAFA
jgi:hypothetical protein